MNKIWWVAIAAHQYIYLFIGFMKSWHSDIFVVTTIIYVYDVEIMKYVCALTQMIISLIYY